MRLGPRFDTRRLTGLGWCAWFASYGLLAACVFCALAKLFVALFVALLLLLAVDLITIALDAVGDSIHHPRRE